MVEGLDRELLSELGFSLSVDSGWTYEVWYHPIDFWVQFDKASTNTWNSVNGYTTPRKEFLRLFLRCFEHRS